MIAPPEQGSAAEASWARAATDACAGLRYRESACLAGLLASGAARDALRCVEDPSASALRAAVARLPVALSSAQQARLGGAILARLERPQTVTSARLHPSWTARFESTERPSAIAMATGRPAVAHSSPPAPWLAEALRALLVERCGHHDPRHEALWEAREVLEVDTLCLAPADDLTALVDRLGLIAAALVLRRLDKRALAALLQRLGETLSRALIGHLRHPPDLSAEVLSVAQRVFAAVQRRDDLTLSDHLRQLGAHLWTCALTWRDANTLRCFAYAVPVGLGELMLVQHARLSRSARPSAIGGEVSAWGLELLQQLAQGGMTRAAYHTRRCLVRPPNARLELPSL